MCKDRCAINVYLENGRILDIEGYELHPWNRGRLCMKARAAVDLVYHPDRLHRPLKRTTHGFEEIDLEQALDEIAARLMEISKQGGTRSISVWKGEAVGFAQQDGLARRFQNTLGTPNYFSNNSQCYSSLYLGYKLVEGAIPLPDYTRSRCIVLWGTNPPLSHPNMTQMIMAARKKAASLIVVDPRLSTICRRADVHASLLPGTDGSLAWGIIHQLVKNHWYNREFVERYTLGFDELAAYAEQFTPQIVKEETGVPERVVREISRLIARAAPQVTTYVGNGPMQHENGVNNIRAIAYLDGLLGSVDQEGGNRLAEGLGGNELTLYQETPLRHMEPIGAGSFPVLYDLQQECHTMMGIDTILTGKPYPLRAMIITAANPVMTNPNTRKVRDALGSLNLLVVRDLYLTETAKLAHYVLPAASFLERTELHTHRMYQVVTLTRKILSFPGCQDEYQFWHDLAHRLGFGHYFPWEDETALNRWILEPTGISLEELEAHPEGIKYKPIRYKKWKESGFDTPSGKIEFTSRYLKNLGYGELAEYKSPAYRTSPAPEYPFVLITGARQLLYYRSRFSNIPYFRTAISGPEVEMHPQDAQQLGVAAGDMVRITSPVGSLTIPVKITAYGEIMPGNIQITHGWGEANVNLLTCDDRFDRISGSPLMKAVEVQVKKLSVE